MQQPPFVGTSPQPSPVQQGQAIARGMTILLVGVALLMMSSGLGLIYYTTVARPAQLRVQATATVGTFLTTEAQGKATANVHAAATARAQANATATMQAQAQATATALQNIYIKATSGMPVLSSSLIYQDRYKWDNYSTTAGDGCLFTGGALHVSVFSKGFYVPCFAHATNFSNFAYQVQVTIHEGDEGGILFRADDANSQFYFFRIGRDGFYNLYVSKDEKHNLSIAYDSSATIRTALNQPNLLTVIAQGNTFYLYINKQFVGTTSDNSYSSGEIGVFAGDNNNGTDVSFSNAQVWSL
jgi:hypothetical protein